MSEQKQLALFDYAQLDASTRGFVEKRTSEIRLLAKRIASDIVGIGQRLIEIKGRLGHGNFGKWLEYEFGWTDQTARNFMHVASAFKSKNFLDLKIQASALYLLAAPSAPKEARDDAIERAQKGEEITHGKAKEIVEKYKDEIAEERDCTNCAHAVDHHDPMYIFCEYHGMVVGLADIPPDCHWDEKKELHVGATAYNNHAISDTPGYDGDEWYTPIEFVESAREVMGRIDLDPASCEAAQEKIKAGCYFSKEDNGLIQNWNGCVFLNPPYSMPLVAQFVEKVIGEYESFKIDQAIVLTNNCTDTKWFHSLLSRFPACFTRGRLGFWRPNHDNFGARQGQVFFYLGHEIEHFVEIFSKHGIVVMKS